MCYYHSKVVRWHIGLFSFQLTKYYVYTTHIAKVYVNAYSFGITSGAKPAADIMLATVAGFRVFILYNEGLIYLMSVHVHFKMSLVSHYFEIGLSLPHQVLSLRDLGLPLQDLGLSTRDLGLPSRELELSS